jgi:hypothetical protein
MMPGTPQTGFLPLSLANGKPLQIYQSMIETPNSAFVATYVDFPPEVMGRLSPDQLLDRARDGAAMGNQLRAEKRLTIAEHPGREYVLSHNDGTVMIVRSLLVAKRLYQLTVVGRAGIETHPDTLRFLQSFRLLTN